MPNLPVELFVHFENQEISAPQNLKICPKVHLFDISISYICQPVNAGDKQISQIFDKDELISALTAPEKLQKDEEISHQNKLNKRHSKTQFSRNQSFQDQNRVPLPSLKENVLENVVERVDLVKDDHKDVHKDHRVKR